MSGALPPGRLSFPWKGTQTGQREREESLGNGGKNTRKPAPKKPRGRPRKLANTRLIEALIQKQDSMSRRCARKINEILDQHVSLQACAFVWNKHVAVARDRLARFVDAAVARLKPVDPAAVRALLAAEVAEALSELDRADFGPVPDVCPADEPRPRVKRSRTLAEARAQHATLQSALMDLKARIVPLDRRSR